MAPIQLEELTIDSVHHSYRNGLYTAEDLVISYLQRIQQLDRDETGPHLNSTLALNPEAVNEAKHLDAAFKSRGTFAGPLHGIPVVVKDTDFTKGLTTTFGSIIAKDFVPEVDSAVVRKLKAAGAIILAKTSMPDFGTDYFSSSTLNGRVRNPYDLDRDTGASSSGTAAALAANLAVIGTGGDSAGSIRIPAALCNLVGFRPTVGLISGTNCLSGIRGQSTSGPMGRTVRDVALLLDALAGFDPADSKTSIHAMARPPVGGSYAGQLGQQDATQGPVRLGIIRSLFGDDAKPEQAAVNQVVNDAIKVLQDGGCELVDVEVPKLQDYMESTSMFLSRSKADMDAFVTKTLNITTNEIAAKRHFHEKNVMIPYIAATGSASPYDAPAYGQQVDQQREFQLIVMTEMMKANVSALVFPTVKVPAPRYADIDQSMAAYFPVNTWFASQLRFPAITVPAGFEQASGMPVGLEIVAPPLSDQLLLNWAFVVESLVKARRSPKISLD
ncbi:amidase [Xylariales sp. PMI_506]|nr:amidase [Xylariales sp. PMI_506]